TVVCCAGAWSKGLAAQVGVSLPVEPVAREVTFTRPVEGLPSRIPLTIDFSTGFYFHREGPGLLFGMANREQPPGFDTPTDPDWLLRVLEVAERRCPRLPELELGGGWKGFYETSPDHNALLGEAPEVARFLYATGFSGHGFLQGPAVGEILRDLVLGVPPFVDVSDLSARRFATSGSRPEHNVI
ncbi:MAG: NAD(P)/FAD-dependent oxidoreductase, partial [Gaiella sp.]